MIQRQFEIIGDTEQTLAFDPPLSADFDPIRVPIPSELTFDSEAAFMRQVIETLKGACGNRSKCMSLLAVRSAGRPEAENGRRIEEMSFSCSRGDCPLPGSSDDREPRHPIPPTLLDEVVIDAPPVTHEPEATFQQQT